MGKTRRFVRSDAGRGAPRANRPAVGPSGDREPPTTGRSQGPFEMMDWAFLPERVGDVEGVADGAPDHLRVLAVGEGLVDGAAAEAGQHVVLGHPLGVGITELPA